MHIEYAKESYDRQKNQKHVLPMSDLTILKHLAMDQVLDLAENVGDDKTKSIAQTMKETAKGNHRYRKVTDAQRTAVAAFLLQKYQTAKAVLAAAFNVPESEMFDN